jgi:CHAT domain-containing protein
MRVSWASGSREQAVTDSFAALGTIETLRAQQPASASQAAVFSPWTEDYYWFSGQLLDSWEGSGRLDDLASAFEATERMRARALADAIERMAQRERDKAPPPPSLAAVASALAPDEAIFSFQLAPWEDLRGDPAGGSWLVVIHRQGARAYRLDGRGEVRSAVRIFTNLLRRGGSSEPAAVKLYLQLFAAALSELPAGVTKLILIPDDALHQLPFAALREAPSALPLGARYELTLAPSASLWLHWRRQEQAESLAQALVLADPPSPSGKGPSDAVRNGHSDLGPLPFARRESRSVLHWLGSGSVRHVGKEATEALVKRIDLSRFGILHFAAHAITDEANPERSGIVLAPGDSTQDGRLRASEIAALPLAGKVAVLSACRTNAGTVLRGEGVMSLARAFFQGGAQAVVASLWPLHDEEAARFFDRFYRHLSRGLSLSAALKAAQAESLAAGVPAADWAGVVVLGRGDLVPIPGGRSTFPLLPWMIAAIAAVLVLYSFLRWRRQTAK